MLSECLSTFAAVEHRICIRRLKGESMWKKSTIYTLAGYIHWKLTGQRGRNRRGIRDTPSTLRRRL
ncbi:MAG: hypothetical protein ACLURV_13170 [Gallintestinimicrobium sp.]